MNQRQGRMLGASVLFFFLLLTGCATTVTGLKEDSDAVLTQGQGYLLIGVETNRDLKSLLIDGPIDIELTAKDIRKGSHFLLINLPAGQYEVEKIRLNNWARLSIDDEENWQFEIKPGQINYVGHLDVVTRGFWFPSVNIELENRASQALNFMEKDFPEILASRTLVYGGPGEDHFYEYVNALKAR